MAGTGSGYDLDVSCYSPDGRVFQVEYAQKCVDNSPTCIAFICKDGIVFATEKLKLSKMLVHGTNRRAYAVGKNSGLCIAGYTPDGRCVLQKAREESVDYKKTYGDDIPGHLLAERVGTDMHRYTLYGYYRPYGCGVLLGVWSKVTESSTLFCVEPSGLVTKYKGKALGKGRQLANTEIEKLDLATLTCEEALFHCARILHKVHDEQKPFELEVNWICAASGYQHAVVPKEKLDAAEEQAKKALEDEDED